MHKLNTYIQQSYYVFLFMNFASELFLLSPANWKAL